MINDNLGNLKYNALPDTRRAFFLRNTVNDQLKTSLTHLLESCDEIIEPLLYKRLIHQISQLDNRQKISPQLFMLNYNFIESIQKNDITAINVIVETLSRFNWAQSSEIVVDQREQLPSQIDKLFYNLASFDLKVQPKLMATDQVLFATNKSMAKEALLLLSEFVPEIYAESQVFLHNILFINGKNIKAGSSINALGLMYIEQHFVSSIIDMIDMIVHESAHQYLHALSYLDEIVLNPPDERYKAPLRQDKRPLIGIYHAIFVLARITYTFKKLLNSMAHSLDKKKLSNMIDHYILRHNLGKETILKYGQLTPIGASIFNTTHKLID